MINNRGILSTTDLLNRQESTSRNSTQPTPLPPIDNKSFNKTQTDTNSSSGNSIADVNKQQSNNIEQSNSQSNLDTSQASDLSAGAPTEAQKNIGQEAAKPGHKTDPGIIKAEVPPSKPKAENSLDTADINSSNPNISQDAPVPNSDRADSMNQLNNKSTEHSAPIPQDSPDSTMPSESFPKTKTKETPDSSIDTKIPIPPRQQFHRMPDIETPSGQMPNSKVPKFSMPNAKSSGSIPSQKMRMPQLRIPKMR
jgi:hypothetical protein